MLALPQTSDSFLVPCIAGQVDSAAALDRHQLSRCQRLLGQCHRVAGKLCSIRFAEPGARPADGTAVRLCVVAAGGEIAVFRRAVGAHRERGHGRARSVVGEIAENRKARPAVGAVQKGIAVPPIVGIGELGQTGGTGSKIGGDERRALSRFARQNGKRCVTARPIQRFTPDFLDHSQRRWGIPQRSLKRLKRILTALQLQFHARGSVAHPAAKPQPVCQPVQERAKADALHNPGNRQAQPGNLAHASSRRMRSRRCSASSATPSPVRLERRNSGPSGFTPR